MSRKFFIDTQSDNVQEIEVVGEEFNHIVNALRHRVGDSIVLCDKKGMNYFCTITKIEKSCLVAKVDNCVKNVGEPSVDICLAVASLKGEKIDILSQKLCELGVNNFIIFNSQNSDVPINEKRLDRFSKISAQATKQCGRSKIMQIDISKDIKCLCEKLKDYEVVLLAYEKSKLSLKSEFEKLKAKRIALIVGCEGGFEDKEVNFISSQLPQTKIVSMGERILRAETACMTLASVCMFEMKELS